MNLINGKLMLSDLAHLLGVTNSSLLQHLKNSSGLGEGSSKVAGPTSETLLEIQSVYNFLGWLKTNGRKITSERIAEVETLLDEITAN